MAPPERKYTREMIVEELAEAGDELTARDLTARVECGYLTVLNRLKEAEEHGEVDKRPSIQSNGSPGAPYYWSISEEEQ